MTPKVPQINEFWLNPVFFYSAFSKSNPIRGPRVTRGTCELIPVALSANDAFLPSSFPACPRQCRGGVVKPAPG